MPIKCTNKNCGHVNEDGNSYCVKCGKLIGKKTVVNKSEYDNLNNELQGLILVKKQLEDRVVTLTTTDKGRIDQLQKKLDNIKKDGSAPSGFRLIRDVDYTNLSNKEEELARLKRNGFAPSGFRLIKENEYTTLSNDQEELARIKKDGYAPFGYHLEKVEDPIAHFWENLGSEKITISKSEYNSLKSRPNISTFTYNSLKRSANMEWYEKLWDDYSVLLTWTFVILLGLGFLYWVFSGEDEQKDTIKIERPIKIEKRDGYWGIAEGSNIILPFEYDSIVCDKYDTVYSRIYRNRMVGLVDNRNGKTIVQCTYMQVGHKQKDLGGELIGVQKSNRKWGFVNRDGKVVGKEYDYARWLTGKEFGDIGKKDERGKLYYGYADSKGNEKISCRYVESYSFSEGLAMVKTSETSSWKCIDTNEKDLFYLKYSIHNGFSESLMAVSYSKQWAKDTRFGFVDREGKLTIGIYFTPYLLNDGSFYYPRFSNGRAYVRYNGRNGYIDTTGKFTEDK